MIVVTGASGKLGSAIVEHLLALVPPTQIVAISRDTSKLSHFGSKGVVVRAGDYDDPSSLTSAFDGATKILIVSAPIIGDAFRPVHLNAAQAAEKSGAKRIYYTSHVGAREKTPFTPGMNHWRMEQDLKALDTPFTAVRNGFFASSLGWMIAGVKQSNRIVIPDDGETAWVGHDDLARTTAKLLAAPNEEDQPEIVNLTGPKAYTMVNIAKVLSKQWGTLVDVEKLPEEEYFAAKEKAGTPAHFVKMGMGFYQAAGHGDFAQVSSDVENITGKKPKSLEELLEEGTIQL